MTGSKPPHPVQWSLVPQNGHTLVLTEEEEFGLVQNCVEEGDYFLHFVRLLPDALSRSMDGQV